MLVSGSDELSSSYIQSNEEKSNNVIENITSKHDNSIFDLGYINV